MKCFIHIYDEAIAVCKKCGKAMCANCSAYSNHSGICPECRREEFIVECNNLNYLIQKNKSSTTANIAGTIICAILAIAFFIMGWVMFSSAAMGAPFLLILIGTLVCGLRVLSLKKSLKPLLARREYLANEINKLTLALQKGSKVI